MHGMHLGRTGGSSGLSVGRRKKSRKKTVYLDFSFTLFLDESFFVTHFLPTASLRKKNQKYVENASPLVRKPNYLNEEID